MSMMRAFVIHGVAAGIVAGMCASAAAQNRQLRPGAIQEKKVEAGYGPDKDQLFLGADPDGTGLPFKEPPPEAVEAAKKAPTPHMPDGKPDLTGFWGPAGWGYAVTQGHLSADATTHFTQGQEYSANQTSEKSAKLKNRMEGTNLPPYKPELVEKVKYLAEHQTKM